LTISPGNCLTIAQESGKKWTALADLQPISFKSDRLLGGDPHDGEFWQPEPGPHRLELVDSDGVALDEVRFEVRQRSCGGDQAIVYGFTQPLPRPGSCP